MPRPITAGLDGSPESRAAAEWAAREAQLSGRPLRLLHVAERVPERIAQAPLLGGETRRNWTAPEPVARAGDGLLREAAEGLRLRHPGIDVVAEQCGGTPYEALTRAAADSELLVLGSRGMGGVGGFLLGSVGLVVVAHVVRPVVLVRAGEQAADEHEPDPAGIPSAATRYRPVLLGLDTYDPDEQLIRFAFGAAQRRRTGLRILHGWNRPSYYVYGVPADPERYQETAAREAAVLANVVGPWREKFPDVEVAEESYGGSPSIRLVEASGESSLVVVGRKIRRRPFGAHIGSITHAVLHHCVAPVAVVPHE